MGLKLQTFDNIADAIKAIAVYRNAHLAIEQVEIAEMVRALSALPSPVDQIVRIGEFLYARRAEVSDEGAALAGGLIAFATVNAWHGLRDNDRGDRIVAALQRVLGEAAPVGLQWPDPADDPAPLLLLAE